VYQLKPIEAFCFFEKAHMHYRKHYLTPFEQRSHPKQMLRKRKTLQTLSGYYWLPVQPTNAVLVEGSLLESKS
jgi:hypothetical protein